ncbi:MAG TPA: lectin-like protein [Crinalium sp.]|jgi:Ca2+-binding RTX toxin-like protein
MSPILNASGAVVANGTIPQAIAPTLMIAANGTTTLNGAIVTLTDGFATTDRLGFQGQGISTGGTVNGLAWNYDTSAGKLVLTGTATTEVYEAALRQITYFSMGAVNAGSARKLQISLGKAIADFANDRFYEFVPGIVSWETAKTTAESRNFFGLQGYLATITSPAENQFLVKNFQQDGWIGASDTQQEGDWQWATGPETGTLFWRGQGQAGSALNGAYTNWMPTEPNNFNGSEHYSYLLGTGQFAGQWNDLANTNPNIKGYFVEYGGMLGESSLQVRATVELNLVGDSTNPTSAFTFNGTDAAGKPVLTFTKPILKGAGSLSIYRSFDNALISTIDVNSGQVTLSADNLVVTIDSAGLLQPGTNYYITNTPGAFKDLATNTSTGQATPQTWNFVTSGFNSANGSFQGDTILPSAIPSPIVFKTRPKPRTLTGTKKADKLMGSNFNDVMSGLDNSDRLSGKRGNDRLYGGNGKDYLDGQDGDDWLDSGSGNDKILGGRGSDVLVGGLGADILTGGLGRDIFTYNGVSEGEDAIKDFNPADDLINLVGIFARPEFSGNHPLTSLRQFVRLEQIGLDTKVMMDVNGSGAGATFIPLVTLQNILSSTINASHFVVA